MVSVFGQGGPILTSDVHQWKIKVVLLMTVKVLSFLQPKIGPSMPYRKIDFFFLKEFISERPSERPSERSSFGNFLEKKFCPDKLTFFE